MTSNDTGPEMRDEYDFSSGVRGKYAVRHAAGTNVVILEPDVAREFPSSDAVNAALRAYARIVRGEEPAEPKPNQ